MKRGVPDPSALSPSLTGMAASGSDCVPLSSLSQNSGVTLASFHVLFLLQTIYESAVSAFPPMYIVIQSIFPHLLPSSSAHVSPELGQELLL